MRVRQFGYWQELDQVINSGKYDTREDFTVVLQPMFRDQEPPVDVKYHFKPHLETETTSSIKTAYGQPNITNSNEPVWA